MKGERAGAGGAAVVTAASVLHTKDADCTVDPATDCCAGCGVEHQEPCPDCGKRAFHTDACFLIERGNTFHQRREGLPAMTLPVVTVIARMLERWRDEVFMAGAESGTPAYRVMATALKDVVMGVREIQRRMEIAVDVEQMHVAERTAVLDAAKEAAQASLDAHGRLIPAGDAWSFITTHWVESEDERWMVLPDEMPVEFVTAYGVGVGVQNA